MFAWFKDRDHLMTADIADIAYVHSHIIRWR
jgi:hypothetical protein